MTTGITMKKFLFLILLTLQSCVYYNTYRSVEDEFEELDSAEFYSKYEFIKDEYRVNKNKDKQDVYITLNLFPKTSLGLFANYVNTYHFNFTPLRFYGYIEYPYKYNYWLDEYMWYDWRYKQNLLYLEWLRYRMYLNDYMYTKHRLKHKYVPYKADYFKYDNHYKKPSIRKSGSNSGASGYKPSGYNSNNSNSNSNNYKAVERPTQRVETRSETVGRQTQTNRTESVRTNSSGTRSESNGNRSSSRSETNVRKR